MSAGASGGGAHLFCSTVATFYLVLPAYLIGAIPFGVIVAKARGVDIRQVGSGNIGATNVARAMGKRWGVLVLLLDAAKGFLPVLATLRFMAGAPEPRASIVACAVGLATVIGHVYPVYLLFKGGKGVATGLGVLLALAPWAALAAAGVYVLVYALTRIGSLGSLLATLTAPVVAYLTRRPLPIVVLLGLMTVIIFYRHRDNILRLLRGSEHKV